MGGIIENLQKVGLTEYESKVYLSLLCTNFNSATLLAKRSGVPRTKIYAVLESLESKGWIKIYSGSPLLFKAVNPVEIFEKYKENYERFLNSIREMLEVEKMEEKFVITNYNIGLENFKEILREVKTVWISNTTAEFLEEIKDSFNEDAEIKVVLFPGERSIRIEHRNMKTKEADIKIVQRVRNVEVPAISVILDEERVFNIFKNTDDSYIISEMLYEECGNCFREWWSLGWGD
jgi:sugar-specific transcriptional regulator TrmB